MFSSDTSKPRFTSAEILSPQMRADTTSEAHCSSFAADCIHTAMARPHLWIVFELRLGRVYVMKVSIIVL